MKNIKAFKVVMLPTEKEAKLFIENNELWIDFIDSLQTKRTKNQHLYIISDEEIKEGDFAINKMINEIGEVVYITTHKVIDDIMIKTKEHDHLSSRNNYNKVIASTDSSITPNSWIPESFIQTYVKCYNEGNKIEEVILEVDIDEINELSSGNTISEFKLKTRPDGSVIIHQSKMYNREEVKHLCWQAFANHKCEEGKIKPSEAEKLIEPFNKWIEQNL